MREREGGYMNVDSFLLPWQHERLWRDTETYYSPAVMFLFKPKVTFLEPDDCSLFNWEAK